MEINQATEEDMVYIREKIQKYLLDGTDISSAQFYVAKIDEKIAAFGRIIENSEFLEIATLGVDYYHRHKNIGMKLLIYLIKEAKRISNSRPIYGVTSRSGLLTLIGFEEVAEYPQALEHKKNTLFKAGTKVKVIKQTVDGTRRN